METYRSSHRFHGPTSSRDLALRTHPLVLGVLLFLASELMFFGGMLAAYYNLRNIATPWPPPDVTLDTTEAGVGTFLLFLSDLTMVVTMHYLSRGRFRAARAWLGATILGGVVFVLIAIHGWVHNTFAIDSNAYGSVFYMLTGIHALHVTVGVLLLGGLLLNIEATAFERDDRAGAEAISYYWHFVFGVWLLIFGSIYFIR